jgi:hypothetical protein
MKTRGDRESRFLLPSFILSPIPSRAAAAFLLSRFFPTSLPTVHQEIIKAVSFEYNTKKILVACIRDILLFSCFLLLLFPPSLNFVFAAELNDDLHFISRFFFVFERMMKIAQ